MFVTVPKAFTLGTGAGIGEGLDGCQIGIGGAGVTLIAAATGRCTGCDGATGKRSAAVSTSPIIPNEHRHAMDERIFLFIDKK